MRERLKKINGYDKNRVWVGTFHAFCYYMLKNYSCYIDISRNFSLIDENDKIKIIKSIMQSKKLPPLKIKDITDFISEIKSQINPSNEFINIASKNNDTKLMLSYFNEYEERKKIANLLDYDDLIIYVIKLLINEKIKRILQNTYKFTLIDECQDTTLLQHELIKQIINEKSPNLFTVADENQSIFGFNHARVENLSDMISKYKMKVENINQCYRCPPEIIKLANVVISKVNNIVVEREEEIVSLKKSNPLSVSIQYYESDIEEAENIAKYIQNMHKISAYSEFAILARTRGAFSEIENVFRKQSIPYIKIGSNEILESEEYILYISFLKLLNNKEDSESLHYLINRLFPQYNLTIGSIINIQFDKKIKLNDAIREYYNTNKTKESKFIYDFYRNIITKDISTSDPLSIINLMEMILQINKDQIININGQFIKTKYLDYLRGSARRFIRTSEDRSLSAFLARLALEKKGDIYNIIDQTNDCVHLLTIHAAKGTEYRNVIIIALEEGIFPHYFSKCEDEMNEERRSMFVAMTRTKDLLMMTCAKNRKDLYGNYRTQKFSRFLFELDDRT